MNEHKILSFRNKLAQEAIEKVFKELAEKPNTITLESSLAQYYSPIVYRFWSNKSYVIFCHKIKWFGCFHYYYITLLGHTFELTKREYNTVVSLYRQARHDENIKIIDKTNKQLTDYVGWTKPDPVKVKRGDVTMVHTPTVTFTAVPSMMHGSWWANGPSYSVSNTSPLFENKKTVFKVSTEKTKRKRKTKKKTK